MFVSSSPTGWFWHSRSWIDYTIAYGQDTSPCGSVFTVRDGEDRVVAAAVALVEESAIGGTEATSRSIGFGGGPVWVPAVSPELDEATTAEAIRLCFDHLSKIASAEGAVSGSTRLASIPTDAATYQSAVRVAALRNGWAERGGATQVLDTSLPVDVIRRGMSKGHRSAITRGLRSMSAALTDPSDRKAFSAYREMHRRAAGRSTRPPRTWELMENWLADGTGLLFGARLASQWVGFSYVLVSGRSAYYASAANHPDVEGQPIGHVLQWAAVEELARRGVVSYELGQQQFAPTSARAPSPKELAIARFKPGSGGQTVPVVEHERFWDASAAVLVLTHRAEEYAATLKTEASPD